MNFLFINGIPVELKRPSSNRHLRDMAEIEDAEYIEIGYSENNNENEEIERNNRNAEMQD